MGLAQYQRIYVRFVLCSENARLTIQNNHRFILITGKIQPVYSTLRKSEYERTSDKNEGNSQIGDEEDGQTEGGIEVEADKTEGTEKSLHHQVRDIIKEVEREESTCRAMEAAHKVDNDVEDDNTQCGYWDVGQRICYSDS